jgi:hypothetical protein
MAEHVFAGGRDVFTEKGLLCKQFVDRKYVTAGGCAPN